MWQAARLAFLKKYCAIRIYADASDEFGVYTVTKIKTYSLSIVIQQHKPSMTLEENISGA